MRKKDYQKPKSMIVPIRLVLMQDTSPEHGKAYDDDSQHPGGALSRQNHNLWNEDED